ncbi:hypothetical protein WJX74_009088 [Apatococcus lobatus]|uniref:Glutamyl-tRNA(Gln) amidotransferase subunit A, chloroplastic/mitochondrial n=1 Tax=Apatococcus lobatus TaxID=904363 RepID=A0AAW1RW06_9CHLO
MSLPGGRHCLISGEPLTHLLHNTFVSAALPRWHQPVCSSFGRPQRPVCASAGVLERSAPAEATSRCSLTSLADSIKSGKRSAAEVTEEYLQRIESLDPQILSYLAVNGEGALTAARNIDEKVAAGSGAALGPLAGVPISIKDNILTQGIETTAASNILSGYHPPYSATIISKLQDAGAIILGKTNLDAFGMGSSTENSDFHTTRNPWDLERVPGGSSGGAAAAMAASLCAASIGTDTGGSIREPAAFCGVVGLKPTYGRVSRHGLVAYGSSLDTIGPLTHSVADAALLLGVIAGGDRHDATSSHEAVPDYLKGLQSREQLSSKPLRGYRLGLIASTLDEGVDRPIHDNLQRAAQHYESLGAEITTVKLPMFREGLTAYYLLAVAEASSNLARYDGVRYGLRVPADGIKGMYKGTRSQGLGAEVKKRILMGTYALSAGHVDAFYKKALQMRKVVRDEMDAALRDVDVLITPTTPSTAFKIGEHTTDPLELYRGDLMTVNLNLAGLPGISVPCGFDDSHRPGHPLPIGMQLIGKAHGEADMLRIAHIFEQTAEWAQGTPPDFQHDVGKMDMKRKGC